MKFFIFNPSRLQPATGFLSLLALLIPLSATTSIAQNILVDAAVETDFFDYVYYGSPQYPGTAEVPLQYIIGNTAAYDSDLTSVALYLYDYTEFLVRNGSAVDVSELSFTGASSRVIVTGADSQLLLGTSSINFDSNSTNTIQILEGGYISAGTIYVNTNRKGEIEIDGAGSTLETTGQPYLGSGNTFDVTIANGGTWIASSLNDSNHGPFTLNLNSGGMLQIGGIFDTTTITTFNFNSGATLVAESTVSNLGTISAGQTVDISNGGSFATATILDGGTLDTGAFDLTNLTFTSGTIESGGALTHLPELVSGHSVDISSGGSFGDVTTLNGGAVTTGDFGMLNLVFTAGTLTTTGTLSNLNSLSSASQTVVIDGGTWSPSGNIDTGNLTIQNAGSVTVSDYDATNLTFTAGTLSSSGSLTHLPTLVSGNSVDLSSGGSFGDATTLNGGAVTAGDFAMTNLTFTTGTLTTTGALTNLNTLSSAEQTVVIDGGSWSPSGNIDAGNLTLQNAGAVTTGDFDAANLTFTSGTLTTTGALTHLNALSSANQTVIIDGGSWTSSGSIDAGNLTIRNDGSVTVSTAYDASNLTFTSGSLTIAGDASNLPTLTSGLAVTLTGGGSLQTATTLNGGTLTGGDFDLDGNLTFTAGTLNVTGTLQNLTTLGSGSTVNLSGASADLLLSQTLNITGGTLNIDNGASVTVLNNVTLGSGSLGFDSNGGSLVLSGGTLNVASMDTTLTLNANASITGHGRIFGDVSLGVGGTIDGDATGFKIYGDVSGSGTLADTTLYGNLTIGNSPGEIYLENTTLSSATIIALAIEGASVGEFDRLFIDADSDVSQATLNITFDGYTPASLGLTFSIVSNASGTTFATITTPDGWTLNSSGVLYSASAVPESGTFASLAGLATLGCAAVRRRRRTGVE